MNTLAARLFIALQYLLPQHLPSHLLIARLGRGGHGCQSRGRKRRPQKTEQGG